LQKNLSKIHLNEKIKLFKKGPFVVESFVSNASFDYDFTLSLVIDGKIVFENCSRENI
jgi:hypothetical protein